MSFVRSKHFSYVAHQAEKLTVWSHLLLMISQKDLSHSDSLNPVLSSC